MMSFLKKNNILLLTGLLLIGCSSNKHDLEYFGYKKYVNGVSTNQKVIPWNSKVGKQMFKESVNNKNAEPFYSLAHHFAGQKTNSTCGPATARIILEAIYEHQNRQFLLDQENSFYKKRNGTDSGHYVISEKNVFSVYNGDEENKDYDVIARQKKSKKHGKFYGGMDIEELGEIISMHNGIEVKTKIVKPDEMSKMDVDNFRKIVKKVTSSNNSYMIVNYWMKAMYDKNSGHFSPLVAYNEKKDMVLIMDVATHLGVWTWVKLEEVYKDMNSEFCSTCNRGYLVIKEK